MARARMKIKDAKVKQGQSTRVRAAARNVRGGGAMDIARAASTVSPAPFAEVFNTYWQAVRTGQAAVLSATQQAYAELLKSFQSAWERDEPKDAFAEAFRRFAEGARGLDPVEDPSAMDNLYREYVEELREVWARPEMAQALEEGYLTYSETVQKAADEAREQGTEASRKYLQTLKDACSQLDLNDVDPEVLAALSRNMMVTVFFTDGVRDTSE